MINYIIQIVLFQVLFLAVYDLFLKKETFFKWNRVYLLVTPILSFIIPLLKFESLQQTIPQEYVVLLPEVVLNPKIIIENTSNGVETLNYLNLLFYVGAGFFLALFLMKLVKVLQLISNSKCIKKENYNLILLENKQSAFSFFNYIFIDKSFIEKEELHVIEHELIHSKQYHTIDLLFFELLKILMWFNPMIYIYQKRITLLHEYISDAEVVKETDKKSYFNNLLATTFNVENISFVNQFYKHSLIKKRIIMITKEKSQKMKQLKYLVLVPLLASMLFYTSCTNEVQDEMQIESLEKSNLSTVQFELSNDKKSGYIKTSKGTYFFKKADDGSVTFYNKFGEEIDISTIADSDISFSLDGKRIDVKANDGIISGAQILDDIPFSRVDKAPIFPDCSGNNEDLKKCLSWGISTYVSTNFNYKKFINLGLSGKQKIYVQFKITKTGDIEIIRVRAAHKDLEEEAKRVVSGLPKMIPGEFGGQKVNVIYLLPILVDIQEK